MQAKDIKNRLKYLIREASTVDPNLASRLDEINRWVKDLKPGSLTAKKFVILFLEQVIRDAEAWLRVQSLPTYEEQQAAFNALKPSLKFWYSYLFPKWLNENDSKFYIWRQKLMSGEFSAQDADLIASIVNNIERRGGTVVKRYIADLSMATDIIVSSKYDKSLCVQLTSLSEEFFQEKSHNWESTLRFWKIDKGLLLSYNPGVTDFVDRIVNVTLYNSDNLEAGIYLTFNF
ncbi:MAG: hypothetical protein HC836_23740 [Richelia sp. RM2_1_2]|nr:hypothetical protein [Richelia sp. SM2_1_7]NJM17401.1 hypothetical protein [Richelia sp. SM1_7_0]NJN09377.1 hypothetical protein [Richelia sp. RM1_1_1]NJO26451.1 hypothetical protein [Richelia sp. SL_2_1]NJO61156.1 hypothetical protein [Richelia sp. RM2_1_2]NJS15909.1 hypothetical protein [Nostocaceae cyanobacterium CSU_2_110]